MHLKDVIVARQLKGAIRRAITAFQPKVRDWRQVSHELVAAVSSEGDIAAPRIHALVDELEQYIADDPAAAKVAHAEVGRGIFTRSVDLYRGQGLPSHLERYTYPAVLSIALSSHCNAACFFCRESDYKGQAVEFENIHKLETAIRHARSIDLTGWGEPFFYPRFEEVVEYVCRVNPGKQLITLTSNGSFLSARWGKLLSGRIASLVLSMNAGTSEVYAEQMRYKNQRFTLENTIKNIREFQQQITLEDRSRIIFHMVANTDNYKDMSALVRLAGELGVPAVNIGNFICAQEEHLDKTLVHVKEDYNAELDRALIEAGNSNVRVNGRRFFSNETVVRGAETCIAPFEQCFVEMPGTVSPCCFLGRDRLGNVYEDGFDAVWFSDLFMHLRKARYLPACKVCTIFMPFDEPTAHMSAFLTTKHIQRTAVPAPNPAG